MLTMHKGYDTDYYTDAVAKGREAYYTDAVAAGEPPGRWYGRGAEALGLTGVVDPLVMKALFTHGLDPRDPATASQETWHQAARFGNPPRNYKSAEEIYAALLDAHPDAGPEQRARAARAGRGGGAAVGVVLRPGALGAEVVHAAVGGCRAGRPRGCRCRRRGHGRRSTGRSRRGWRSACWTPTGRCWTSWPSTPATPARGITAAGRASGWTRPTSS